MTQMTSLAPPSLSLLMQTVIIATQHVTAEATGRCELHRTRFKESVTDYGTNKHVIRTVNHGTITECYENCINDCSCVAFQLYQNTKCELLHEDRKSAPNDFVTRRGYKYYHLDRIYKCPSNSCNDSMCSNNCCASNPCLNGATCTELCEDPRLKFKCICLPGYTGKFCKTKIRTCKDYLAIDPNSTSGKYFLLDEDDLLYRTFCDFGPENGMAWTLVESFAFSNKDIYRNKPFYHDHPINEANFSWSSFRLSEDRMEELLESSTHFRATCNFSASHGKSYTDYLRVKLSVLNLLEMKSDNCFTFEYFSVAGSNCSNCDFAFYHKYRSKHHPHIDCEASIRRCDKPMSVPGCTGAGEDLFGVYDNYISDHSCSSSQSATTQWWFGS